MNEETMTRAMFGENAVKVPIRIIVQDPGAGVVLFAGAMRSKALTFGSELSHQYILGDAIIRPHVVLESDHPQGMGISGIMTSSMYADPFEWVRHGNVILDPLDIIKNHKY